MFKQMDTLVFIILMIVLNNSKAKIWVITKNNSLKQLDYIDNIILLPKKINLYNYVLQYLVDLIFINYQKK